MMELLLIIYVSVAILWILTLVCTVMIYEPQEFWKEMGIAVVWPICGIILLTKGMIRGMISCWKA